MRQANTDVEPMGKGSREANTDMFQQRCGTNGKGQYREGNKHVTSREGSTEMGQHRHLPTDMAGTTHIPTQMWNQRERAL